MGKRRKLDPSSTASAKRPKHDSDCEDEDDSDSNRLKTPEIDLESFSNSFSSRVLSQIAKLGTDAEVNQALSTSCQLTAEFIVSYLNDLQGFAGSKGFWIQYRNDITKKFQELLNNAL